jgi:epoxide hydrolase-like predicted phosphatase
MIRAIVSDFGGVLTTPLDEGFRRIQDDVGVPPEAFGAATRAAALALGENPLHQLERGELTEQAFLAMLERELAGILGREVTLHGFGERYLDALDPNDELFAYYRGLHEREVVRMAMLTNNVREWEPHWRAKLPIDEIFETVVDSCYVGLRKPDPRIYGLMLQRLELPADACAFVDDVDVNIEAARELGFHAVHFQDTAQAIAELDALLA